MTGWRLRFEPAISPLFRAWWRLRRPMTLGVRGVACDEAGRVLMVRHTYALGWHLPGGGVERGETAVAAIVREMAEEGGVEAIGAPLLVGFYANHANFPNDHIALYRIEKCPGFGNGLVPFFFGIAVDDDPAPDVETRDSITDHHSSDRDAEIDRFAESE